MEDHRHHLVRDKKNKPTLQLINSPQYLQPLLSRMTLPTSPNMKALNLFKYCSAVGITHYDTMVPYCSAAICGKNLFYDFTPSSEKFFVVYHSGFDDKLHDIVLSYYNQSPISSSNNNGNGGSGSGGGSGSKDGGSNVSGKDDEISEHVRKFSSRTNLSWIIHPLWVDPRVVVM